MTRGHEVDRDPSQGAPLLVPRPRQPLQDCLWGPELGFRPDLN